MNWTPQQLLTFQTVAQAGTMTAAAASLGYTTGAVSQQISNLESAIGQKLFTRLPRKLMLTDAGEVLLEESGHILESYSQAAAALERLAPNQDVSLRLGVFTSVAVAFLPQVLEKLHSHNPHIHVQLQEIHISDASDALTRGAVDLALSVNYPNIPMPVPQGVISHMLHKEKFSLVTGSASTLSVQELNDADWILPPEESHFGKSVRLALHSAGISPRVRHVLENHVASVAMAEAGQGVTPVTATTMALSSRMSATQNFPGDPYRNIVMFRTEKASNRPSIHALESTIRSVISEAEDAP